MNEWLKLALEGELRSSQADRPASYSAPLQQSPTRTERKGSFHQARPNKDVVRRKKRSRRPRSRRSSGTSESEVQDVIATTSYPSGPPSGPPSRNHEISSHADAISNPNPDAAPPFSNHTTRPSARNVPSKKHTARFAAPKQTKILRTELAPARRLPHTRDKRPIELPVLGHEIIRAKRQPGSAGFGLAPAGRAQSIGARPANAPLDGGERSRVSSTIKGRNVVHPREMRRPSSLANRWASRQQQRATELKTGRSASAYGMRESVFGAAERQAHDAFNKLMNAANRKSLVEVVRAFGVAFGPENAAMIRSRFKPIHWHQVSVVIEETFKKETGRDMLRGIVESGPEFYKQLAFTALECAIRADTWRALFYLSTTLLDIGEPRYVEDLVFKYQDQLYKAQGRSKEHLVSWTRDKRIDARIHGEGIRPMAQVYIAAKTMQGDFTNDSLRKMSTFRGQDTHYNLRYVKNDIGKILLRQPNGSTLAQNFAANWSDVMTSYMVEHPPVIFRMITRHSRSEAALTAFYQWIITRASGPAPLLHPVPFHLSLYDLAKQNQATNHTLPKHAFCESS